MNPFRRKPAEEAPQRDPAIVAIACRTRAGWDLMTIRSGADALELVATERFAAEDARAAQWIHGQRAGHAVVALPGADVIVRAVQLPSADEGRLESALQLNATTFVLGRTCPAASTKAGTPRLRPPSPGLQRSPHGPTARWSRWTRPTACCRSARPTTTSTRLPAWATDLEDRRRMVEPAIRTRSLAIADGRRSAGALVFLLDIAASSEAHAAVLIPCRMQLDVAGNATGRPRPVVLGPADADFEQLDAQERGLLAQLVGTVAVGEMATVEPLERRTVSRIAVSPQSAPAHLAMLCELGRLVLQPEPRRAPDDVVPLTWDGGRPWEF
ncbi:MAG: hypothetical protein EBU31_10105, partial [Proteobacteria bacterium]|nr:hypothetical protein [Pseudomonadota bacterium]